MGFRFRKSINLGGGFKINLSKSGVGYSWGTKGYRVTKTARGTTRKTYSIPGTGISYVKESGKKQKRQTQRTRNSNSIFTRSNTRSVQQPTLQPTQQPTYQQNYNLAPEYAIRSAEIDQFRAAEEGTISEAVERTMRVNWFGTLLLFAVILIAFHPAFIILPVVGIVMKIAAHTFGRVDLEYSFDAEKEDEHNRRIGAWQLLAEGKKEWQVITEQFNNNRKVNAGASRNLKRVPVSIRKGKPYFIRTNVETIWIKLANKESLIILPDKVFFVRKRKVGTIEHYDFQISVSSVQFIETDPIPKDAQVIGQTWQYVNKNGTPDQRYRNNRQIPVCLYGQVFLRSSGGLNVELQISNVQNTRDFAELIH